MDPHSPNKLIVTKYCFLILEDDTSFFFSISSLFFLLFYVIINFYKNYFIIIILFIFSCSGIFRDVPACSEMFRVPGFIDALDHGSKNTVELR